MNISAVRGPRSAPLALILFLLAISTPAQRHDSWRVIGPGGGGSMFIPAVSPHDPNVVLIACDMTGAYISRDAGRSWRMFNLGAPVRQFAFDPRSPRIIYAVADGLFRSEDAGDTWRLILPRPGTVRRILMGDDHAGKTFDVAEDPRGAPAAVAVDSTEPGTLYAAVRYRQQFSLWTSSDQGATWRHSADLPGGARRMWIDPRTHALYVAGTNAVSVRQDGEWRAGESPGSFTEVSAGFPAAGPAVFYAVCDHKIFVSENGGAAWRESPLPGFQGEAVTLATSLFQPDTAYVSYRGLRDPASSSHGVAKTSDRGRHWQLVWQDTRSLAENVHEAWIAPRFGPGWGGNPIGIGVAPRDPALCYTSDSGRSMRTRDGGKTWDALYAAGSAANGWTTTGLDVTTCYGVHFDPFDARRMFISYTDIGLFGSSDGGATWTSATREGVPREWTNTTYWIEFDPSVRGRMWGVMSGVHDLPRPKMWARRSPDTYNGGVVTSDDGGRTWKVSNEGMPQTAATHILLDPESPPSARVLYVAGFGRGVFKSSDGGAHWKLQNTGIEGSQPFAWRLARDSKGALYVLLARRDESSGTGALYRSTSGAARWERLTLPPGVTGPNGVAIDPRDPRRLYLAVWGRSTPEGAQDGGIYLSQDAGATWKNVLSRDQHIYDVTIDPRDPRVLYAAGFESSAWRSTDAGATWQRVRGFNFKWGHRVIPDPRDRAQIYITTFGGSVWHGPAAGDPHAIEDVVGPPFALAPR